jgi:SAM-dependent methyltransferase
MYGPAETDLVVKYFDQAIGIGGEAELAWYLSKTRAFGGPVLDLACGSGRLALPLASEGFDVTGIDQSPGMLNQFRRKLCAASPEIRERVRIERQSMSQFELGVTFGTVVCCDAFFHNLTVDEEIACLSRVARHMTRDSVFVFNLPKPTCDFIQAAVRSAGAHFEERGRFPLEDGSGELIVENAHAARPLEQTVTTTLRITRLDAQGRRVEQGESTWTSRYLFRWEAVHLLHRCGFAVASLVGDYRGGPVTEGGQLVFEARLA